MTHQLASQQERWVGMLVCQVIRTISPEESIIARRSLEFGSWKFNLKWLTHGICVCDSPPTPLSTYITVILSSEIPQCAVELVQLTTQNWARRRWWERKELHRTDGCKSFLLNNTRVVEYHTTYLILIKSVWLVIGFGNLGLYCVHFCLRRWDANTNFSKLVTSQTLFTKHTDLHTRTPIPTLWSRRSNDAKSGKRV